MTLKTKSAITTEITSNLATNGTGAITATLLRQVVQDMVDSYLDWTASGSLIFTISAVNFNSGNTDNAITITLPTGYTRWKPSTLLISGASGTLTTSTIGLFTATAGGGSAIVTGATPVTVSTASDNTAGNMQNVTLALPGQTFNVGTVYFRVQTPQGSAATANVSFVVIPVP